MNLPANGSGGESPPGATPLGNHGVVGFLARSKDRLLLPRKLARWRREPSAETLCDVVQALLRLGDVEQAWAHARQGYARFKDVDLVRELHRIASRAHAEVGLEAARAEIATRPSANAFLKVARCAVLLRDLPTAFEALQECMSRFPTSAPAHAAYAELLEQRWLRDLAAVDGRAAIAHLRKAWRLDGADCARPLRLAAFLARVGAQRSALAVVNEVLQIHESNADALELRERLTKLLAAEAEAGQLDAEADDDVDALLRSIEEQGRVAGDPADVARVGRECERLRQFLPAVRRRTGCEKAFVVEPRGAVYDETGVLGANALTSLAANLVHSGQLTTRRADLGTMAAVTLQTTGGSLLLQRAQRCMVGLLLDRAEGVGAARRVLEDLVAGRLHPTAAEPAR
jgi:tetratricopeptide (TPR) repeat protein